MATEHTYPATLRSFGKESAGEITINHLAGSDRTGRALRAAGITMAATIASVFIPVAHFILVPLGLLATPIVAWIAYRPTTLLTAGHGLCPACNAELKLNSRALPLNATSVSISETCSSCSRPVEISTDQFHSESQ